LLLLLVLLLLLLLRDCHGSCPAMATPVVFVAEGSKTGPRRLRRLRSAVWGVGIAAATAGVIAGSLRAIVAPSFTVAWAAPSPQLHASPASLLLRRPAATGLLAGSGGSAKAPRLRQRVSAAALPPGKYRALTKIRLRKAPDVNAEVTGATLVAGEEFEADEVSPATSPGGLGYLRVADGSGWAFDQGVAGRWAGQQIVEAVEDGTQEPLAVAPAKRAAPATPPPSAAASAAAAAVTVEAETVASATAASPAPPPVQSQAAASSFTPVVALATAGIETVRLPAGMLGAGFEFVRLQVDGCSQPLTFMLGTSFPANALTSKGDALVNAASSGGENFQGGWLKAQGQAASRIDLKNVKFLGTGASIGDLVGCQVVDTPQAQLAEQLGVEVHGILGQPFFEQFDVDIDRYRGRAELYAPGEVASQGFNTNVKHIPGIALPFGNLGVAIKGRIVGGEASNEAMVGLIDSSAAHTVINWEAAKALGFSGPNDPRCLGAAKVLGAGQNGQAEEMPVVYVKLSVCGAPEGVRSKMHGVSKEKWDAKGGEGWYFEDLSGGPGCVDFGAVNVAIGNVLTLAVLDDSKIGPFKGPAVIVGQDLLFQADRIVLNMKDSQMWIEPGDLKDDPEM